MDDIDSNFEDRMIAFRLWARNFQQYHILTWQELVVDASASLCQGQRWFAQWCSKSLWLKFVSVWEVLVGERTGIDILQELRPRCHSCLWWSQVLRRSFVAGAWAFRCRDPRRRLFACILSTVSFMNAVAAQEIERLHRHRHPEDWNSH